MIFKVQRSQFSSDGKTKLLIYNKDQSIKDEFLVSEDDPLFDDMGDRAKIYVEANIQIIFQEVVEDQDW